MLTKYGLGSKRTLDQLIEFTGIDLRNGVVFGDRCVQLKWVPFVADTGTMHTHRCAYIHIHTKRTHTQTHIYIHTHGYVERGKRVKERLIDLLPPSLLTTPLFSPPLQTPTPVRVTHGDLAQRSIQGVDGTYRYPPAQFLRL